jgi:hypothetical protein
MPRAEPGGAIDICDAFGPLASMHAALDRAGAGMPCGVVTRFEDSPPAAIAAAIEKARSFFPTLQMQLAWHGDRPVLEPASVPNDAWQYRLTADGPDVWLEAHWPHATADGLSMLCFVDAIGAIVRGQFPRIAPRRTLPSPRPASFLGWLPVFLFNARRGYLHAADRTDALSTSWMVLPPASRDRILAAASDSCGGTVAWLAAASALGFAHTRGTRDARISLNIPVSRRSLEETNGFGFGVGSIRFPVHVRPGADAMNLARTVSHRLRHKADRGWDRNLERLLTSDPRWHQRYAAVEASRRPDPNLTISWKGFHSGIGGPGRPRDTACFAAAPTLHVSAHADVDGFSLSVTSWQSAAQQTALLEAIAGELGCTATDTQRRFELAAPAIPDCGIEPDPICLKQAAG